MNELLLRRAMMQRSSTVTRVVFSPSSYDEENSTYKSFSTSYPITNAYTGTASDSFARIFINTGSGVETKFYFKFDTSTIPSDAVIKSVVMKTRLTIQTIQSTAIATRTHQVCVGTEAKGTTSTFNTTDTIRELDTGGSWTWAELQDITLYIHVVRGTTSGSTNFQVDVFGADLIVDYNLPEEE